MERTPKIQRKFSLSLNRLSTNKRQTGSPANRLSRNVSNAERHNNNVNAMDTPHSPSILSDSNFHTPPHRKQLNWDDGVEDSPKLLDVSFSPSGLLSQTLAIESPEVGWRWTEATPDSAYADSSFNSAGCSSTESKTARTRTDVNRQRLAFEEQRKAMEIKILRAEKMRTDELLKRRYAKLEEQLKGTATLSPRGRDNNIKRSITTASSTGGTESATESGYSGVMSMRSFTPPSASPKAIRAGVKTTQAPASHDFFSDFLNDSDSDCLLMEATQHLESKIVEMTQKPAAADTPVAVALAASTTTSQNKRSSLYMKFLEDDSADDWFDSLDDVIREATQSKKARISLQRYKSLPMGTTTAESVLQTHTTTTTPHQASMTTAGSSSSSSSTATSSSMAFKRHASSHAFSPVSSSSSSKENFQAKH